MKMNIINTKTRHRRGFTLVELMVVIGIILIMTAAAIPTVRFLTKDREIREASRMLSSYVEAAREEAKATGRAGIYIERSDNDLNKCVRVYRAKFLPVYQGDTTNEVAYIQDQGEVTINAGMPGEETRHDEWAFVPVATNSLVASGGIKSGDEIRFGGRGVWYPIYEDPQPMAHPDPLITTLHFVIKFRVNVYTTPTNKGLNIFPIIPDGAETSFEIRRQPTKKNSSFIDLPKGTFIDLRNSGFAVKNFAAGTANRGYIQQDGGGAGDEFCSRTDVGIKIKPIVITFDKDGSLSRTYFQFYYNPTSVTLSAGAPPRFTRPELPTNSVYLLVAADNTEVDDTQAGAGEPAFNNMGSTSNFWLSITRSKGKVTTSNVAPSGGATDINGASIDYNTSGGISRAERMHASRLFVATGESEAGN